MSIIGKKWKILNQDNTKNLFKKLCENRNLTCEESVDDFFNKKQLEDLHDPFLMKNMELSVQRILKAIKEQERIIIFGDYDVDGVTSSAILYDLLKTLGAKVSYRLPDRLNDGYGLNLRFIQEIIALDVKILITVDCGIANKELIQTAAENGIDVIVTDHHTVPEEFPDSAYAVLHPQQKDCTYPYKELTGAGVAFKFAQAIIMNSDLPDKHLFIQNYFDLAGLGTLSDLAPLTGENRIIVKNGLYHINRSPRHGIKSLIKAAWKNIDKELKSTDVSFYLAPRLNAAGRIQSPYYALQLLLSTEKDAEKLALYLNKLNQTRRMETQKCMEEAENLLLEDIKKEKILIAWSKDWHLGIIGLVAGKLNEKYNIPSIIMTQNNNQLVGSARSPEIFNIIQALTYHKKLLPHFGGHKQAAGFSLELKDFEEFKNSLREYASNELKNKNISPKLEIDCEIETPEINFDTYSVIEKFEPFGVANNEPIFLFRNTRVSNLRELGSTGKHISFNSIKDSKSFRCIAFNFAQYSNLFLEDKKMDLVIKLNKNTWQNNENLEFQLIDAAISTQ
ncbi:single-stranded-DNA-specific exonuclease RecJ [Candidatus Peregrinibacteria bacterium RIFOXYC2_FULL_33_13]|nr:MAG: Exonuclease RecJ [Candidatus Peregrinibacteria bacterium GW2011_GWA2_33_10]KKP39008.1 MAG: exonuclease RecJ, single-stranded-DNA-specific exonuclease [Candidatus Peregrinibacteria bacterium GW2011_GWC2_33_13]OGJ52540.1 MAG: single-stranded-DNA-specific exonuclease RecJ [Candidatus Peregrinibacteria bacterium RIFOXYC2_FULL_33_13]